MTSVTSSTATSLKASQVRAADGDYKTAGPGHRVKDSDGDYKAAPKASAGPAANTASTTLAAVAALNKGGEFGRKLLRFRSARPPVAVAVP